MKCKVNTISMLQYAISTMGFHVRQIISFCLPTGIVRAQSDSDWLENLAQFIQHMEHTCSQVSTVVFRMRSSQGLI